jgi:ring-1,2-phenylacetyl-CoA epoxidase subunit PaaC
MTTPSITIKRTPEVEYLLRLGDTALILGQRLGEWCGHAPVLEEDIALTNMALDLIGQSRALLTHAGQLEGARHDEDQLAFLRDERDYRNVTMAELPNGPRRGERRFRLHDAAQRDAGDLVAPVVGEAARIP